MSWFSKCHEAIVYRLLGPRNLCLKQNYKGLWSRNIDASIQICFWVSQCRTNGCGLPKRDSTPAKGIDSCSQTSSEARAASATILTEGAGVYNCYSVNNKCISFVRITKNALISKLLHVSVLTGPSSGSTQLYKAGVLSLDHPQYAHLRNVPWTHSNLQAAPITVLVSISILILWQTCDNSAYWGWYNGRTIVLYNCTLNDDGPVRTETCSSLRNNAFL